MGFSDYPLLAAATTSYAGFSGNPHRYQRSFSFYYLESASSIGTAANLWGLGGITQVNSANGIGGQVQQGRLVSDLVSTATNNYDCYISAGSGGTHTYAMKPTLNFSIIPNTVTGIRVWVGTASSASFLLSSTPGSSNAVHGAMFRFDTGAGDTNWKAVTFNGVSQTVTDTGVPYAAATAADLCIDMQDPAAIKFYIGNVLKATNTTTLPGSTTALEFFISFRTLAAAITSMYYGRFYMETD